MRGQTSRANQKLAKALVEQGVSVCVKLSLLLLIAWLVFVACLCLCFNNRPYLPIFEFQPLVARKHETTFFLGFFCAHRLFAAVRASLSCYLHVWPFALLLLHHLCVFFVQL